MSVMVLSSFGIVFLYAGLSTCCKYSFNHESNIEVSPFFCLSSSLMVAWKANVSHGLLLMLLTVCPSG